jgi:hypothetical protein
MTREPRLHVAPNETLAVPYFFGQNVGALAPGARIAVGQSAFGWPAAALSAVPAGDYLVQAVLNRYETFRLADGRVLELPPDRGEGQQWALKPGNFYSTPVRLHWDPRRTVRTELVLDHEIAAIEAKPDTEFVKHVRIRSELLSRFWGRDVEIGAYVLLPKDFAAHPEAYDAPRSGSRTGLLAALSPRRLQSDSAGGGLRVLPEMGVPGFSALPRHRDRACEPVFRRQLCREFRESRAVWGCDQSRVDSGDRTALSRHRVRLGALHVRRIDRWVGGARDAGVLSRHV